MMWSLYAWKFTSMISLHFHLHPQFKYELFHIYFTSYPKIVGPALASSGQTIATFEGGRSQHCWAQHVACVGYSVPTCCDMLQIKYRTGAHAQTQNCCTNLAKRLRHHATSTNVKPRPNDRNIQRNISQHCWAQHVRALGHPVATCCVLLAQVWSWSNLSQQYPTCRIASQHGGQMCPTCCAQQCCDMLCWHVAIVWPGL